MACASRLKEEEASFSARAAARVRTYTWYVDNWRNEHENEDTSEGRE